MNKVERLAYIKKFFGVKNTVGLLPVSRAEIREETVKVHSKVAESMNDSTSEGDKIESPVSSLQFDTVETVETDYYLTRAERKQLAREVAQRRAVRAWLVPSTLLLVG